MLRGMGWAVVLAVAMGMICDVALAQDEAPAVQVVGVSVLKPLEGARSDVIFGQPGTTITLLVESPHRYFIKFDDSSSEVRQLADGQERKLEAGLGPFPKISDDGHIVALEIRSDAVPAQGAGELRLQADLVLQAGKGQKTAEQKNLALKKDSKLTAGPVPLTITKVEEQAWGDAVMTVEFETDQAPDALRQVRFFDASDQEIPSQKISSGAWGSMDEMSYSMTYGLNKKVESATVKVEYFEQVEQVPVSVEKTITLGL